MITDIHAEDWDLMILLDACRLDTFEEVNTIPGDLQVFKTGSSTSEFTDRFFQDMYLGTVYISGNPWIHKGKDYFSNKFRDIVEVWDFGWDWVNHTVHPAVMSSEIYKAIANYKYEEGMRILSHWIQPHHPFIGDFRLPFDDCLPNSTHEARTTIWHRLKTGAVSVEDFVKAYKSNLEFALRYVEAIVRELHTERKIVITSDHGNCFGEDDIYGHPVGSEHPILTEVPWLVIDW